MSNPRPSWREESNQPGLRNTQSDSLRNWVTQADDGAGRRSGLSTEDQAELRELRKENRNEPVYAVGPSDVCPVQRQCLVPAVSSFPP